MLQEKENERRDNPECKRREFGPPPERPPASIGEPLSEEIEYYDYYTDYWVFTGYEYDITKTNSLVSPYTAKVRFKGTRYVKTGKTLKDCLNSDWKNYGEEGSPFLQKYAFQDGEWALKEQEGR